MRRGPPPREDLSQPTEPAFSFFPTSRTSIPDGASFLPGVAFDERHENEVVPMSGNRLGYVAALAVVAIGVAYAITLAAGFARHGFSEPIADPILAVMEVITLISVMPLVVMMSAVSTYASPERRIFGVIALAFTIMLAGATASVHFVQLTAARQLGGGGIVWPSTSYAVELLAWNLFLGLSLLFAAPVFEGSARARAVRRTMWICGALCVAGIAGPLAGDMRLQLIGVAGYAVVLPCLGVMLARLFRTAAFRHGELVQR